MNKVLEVARTGKLIGASLDAKVYIYTSDAIMASQLAELCTTKIDADTLSRLFITSQVCLQLQYFQRLKANEQRMTKFLIVVFCFLT